MILERLRQQAEARPRRVLLPESRDPRVIDAARQLVAGNLARPIFLTPPPERGEGVEILSEHPNAADWQQRVDAMLENVLADRGAAAVDEGKQDPLMRAAALLRLGYADAAVAGSIATTAQVLRAGLRVVGLATESKLLSSCFLMELPDRVITFADCAVVPEPDAGQLAQIAISSGATHHQLTGEAPRIAMLSFSTRGSARHPQVDKVREAVQIARRLAPDLEIDGELQFDAAFVPAVGRSKAPDSGVAGRASVFVFPDLGAANIGYKIAERVAGATAIGPILQGLARPWMDLSRGCKAADIASLAVIATRLADGRK